MIMIIVPFYKYFNRKIKAFCNRDKSINTRKRVFWKQEVLGGNLIALDITRKKLIFCNQINSKSSGLIIHLKDVSSCTIKRQYHSINAGGLMQKKLQDYLKNIGLYVRFKNSTPAIALALYEAKSSNKEEAVILESKAREWQTTISNLLIKQIPERA